MSTTRKQIGYGYQGDEAKELQTLLNNNGYKLDVDGIVGKKTVAAIKDYQQANGLTVDGIVGKNTWGSLLGGSNLSGSSSSSTPTVSGSANQDNPFTLESVKDQIANREEFKFDLNADVLYKQYADKYMRQGQMAMMDTMGQASMMTGGYGNSYAQSVGQQAYQSELQNLNDIVPQLYQMAYARYNQEGQDLYNQYTLLSQEREFEEGVRQYNDNAAYTKAMAYIQAGVVPSEDILESAGISADDAKSLASEYKALDQGTGTGLQNVASMSPAELVDNMNSYADNEDYEGLAIFLQECINTNRLTETMAHDYYKQYTGKSLDEEIVDTTVKPTE